MILTEIVLSQMKDNQKQNFNMQKIIQTPPVATHCFLQQQTLH
jgi:hypothetical protein